MAETTTPNAREPFSGAAVDPDERFEPPSDIILRSSDAIDFHCHKNILAHVSPFFADMFAAVSGNQDIQKDGKAVIPLVEPSSVLYGLLPRVYPAHNARLFSLTNPADLTDICPVHEAANKFQMVRAQALIEDMLLSSPLLDTEPHRFFAIGCIRNIVPLIRKAALCTLRDTVNPIIPFIPEFELITGNRALELSNFYQRCALRAQSVAGNTHSVPHNVLVSAADEATVITSHEASGQPFVWWREEGHAVHCGPIHQMVGGVWTQEVLPPQWYRNHVRQVSTALRFVPNGTTAHMSALDVAAPERAAIATCPACAQYALHDLANFAAQLKRLVEWTNGEIAEGMW
ncbi:hypothetical protein FB45DRAFT_1026018 [Roridomyces roridus]|uniref:BTB domain-containing protein n=1 Tax=Roridomyces roridus TaxID=1738132 RepID=A0AAD7C038_9AGAR|nr:hypothetical protein FB45DRAFT_1026018 [Roridomyces roridus]